MVIWVTKNGVKEQALARMVAGRLTDSGLSTFIFHVDIEDEYLITIQRLKQLQQMNNLYAVVVSILPLNPHDLVLSDSQLITVHCLDNGEQTREDANLNLCIQKETVSRCVAKTVLFIHKRLGCFT